jgi:fructose-1-phosphate kinase PfkB-like protein
VRASVSWSLLEEEAVDATVISTASTRGTYTVVDDREADVIEVHEPGGALAAEAAARLTDAAVAAARDATVVVSAGSIAAGLDPSFHATVAGAATGFTIVDTSDVEAMRRALGASPDLVKPNLTEARALVGEGAPEELARRLRAHGARNVWLSLGPDGSVLCTPDRAVRLPAPLPPRVVNAVGAGDALVGGLVAGLHRGMDLIAAARLGVAAAAAKVGQLHPARVDLPTVERLARSIHPEPVKENA